MTNNNDETASKSVELRLPHCGELEVKDSKIDGWFHPISMTQWRQIVGFHKYASVTYNSETVSYHRWNPLISKYDTIIPHQVTAKAGLSVKTDWTDPKNVELLDQYGKTWGVDFFPACTIHTHVAAGAFESGTDAGDEEDLPGWHITLGHLTKHHVNMDIHARFRLPKLKRVGKLTSLKKCYVVPIKNLFNKNVRAEEITQTPWDDTHFHHNLENVSLR
jgi:hypothetical protein|tara:strand:- start:4319 stop:4975 length:657 start_codon:yes stop_codon:yes gene_type:complete